MQKILLFIGCLAMCCLGHAQIITVTDQESNQPLEHVIFLSATPKAQLITNARGQVDITTLSGAEKIEISMVGYATQIKSYAQLLQAPILQMQVSINSLEGVVVSATRWNQPRQKNPSRVRVISQKEIALQNPQTAADLLGASGEVFIQKSQQGGGSPMIRGFSTNRLLYAVDGVRMNTAIFRSGNLQNVISLDPFAMESAEVLFGPGSIMYGSDAIGGVMTFQTLTPELSLTDTPLVLGKAIARYSSANNEQTAHFDINIGGKKWGGVTSFTTNRFGDLRMGQHGPQEYLRPFYVQRFDTLDVAVTNPDPLVQKQTGYEQINLMQKLRFQPDNQWDIQYGFHYSTTSNYDRYDRLIRTRRGNPRAAEWYYGPQVWMMNQLSVNHKGETRLYDQSTLRLAHQFFEESRNDRDFNNPERRTNIEKVDALSANLDFLKTLPKTKLFYGLEFVQNKVRSTGSAENIRTRALTPFNPRYPNATWNSYAAYFTAQYDLTTALMLQAGARYNQFELEGDFSNNSDFEITENKVNATNQALTGSLGIIYHPARDWSFQVNASSGFRAPNVDDLGKTFDPAPQTVLVPNPALQAEYAYNLEAGLTKIFDETLKLEVTAYYTLLENALVRRDFRWNGQDSIEYKGELSRVQAIQNAAQANVRGVQAQFEVKLPGGFGLSSQFNYQQGEEENDDGTTTPSRHAAPWFGVSRFTYNYKSLNLQFYAIYSGEKKFEDLAPEEQDKPEIYAIDANGNPYSPSWYTLNIKVLYEFDKTFSVSAGMENLTDQRYRPYSSGLAAPGRNFILALRANF